MRYITQTQPDKIWKNGWLFIPFIILFIIMAPYYTLSSEEKRILLTDFEESSRDDFGWVNQVVSLLHVVFQIFILVYYLRFEKRLLEEFSEVESLRIQWLKHFLILTLAATVLAVFSFFARTWNIPVLSQLYSFHFIGIVLLFYWLSFKALTQPILFGIVKEATSNGFLATIIPEPEPEKYKKSTLETEQLNDIFQKVKHVLLEQQLFRKNDLTLTQLSVAVGIPRHQLSQAINSCYTGNFFDLINDHRVETFKQLASLPAHKHLSLLGIAQEAGFSSKASFYSVFKKKTGMTPTEFLERNSNTA